MIPKYISTFGKNSAVSTLFASAPWDQMPEPYEGRAVYQLIGTFERVTQPAAALPFEVGKIYKDGDEKDWRILATDRKFKDFPIVAMRLRDGIVDTFTADGELGTAKSVFDLIPDKSPATTRVEFVPVTGSDDAGAGE